MKSLNFALINSDCKANAYCVEKPAFENSSYVLFACLVSLLISRFNYSSTPLRLACCRTRIRYQMLSLSTIS